MSERPHDDPDRGQEPMTGAPPWVKRVMITGAVLLIILALILLTGHGPARHTRAAPGEPALTAASGQPPRLR